MGLVTISEITRAFGVSARTLRYYDSIGLLRSARKDDYAYRVYDERAIKRLGQIVALRKLRIPLKTIASVLDDGGRSDMTDVFARRISELDGEIEAARVIRDILRGFASRLADGRGRLAPADMLEDPEITAVIQSLSLSKSKLKEGQSMDELNKANDTLSTLRDARIIYLPPATVASSHYFGENPEGNARKALDVFCGGAGLHAIKPDLRVYGFNNPSPKGDETYGYEFWVTIPDDMEVPPPLQKKRFGGGLYAAHCIRMGDFHEWQALDKWVKGSPEYEYDPREPSGMGGCLEEHLNAYSLYAGVGAVRDFTQLDLLMPIEPPKSAG